MVTCVEIWCMTKIQDMVDESMTDGASGDTVDDVSRW